MPSGSGGGCVMEGPFSNYTVNIGPSSSADPLAFNPRCIKRDLNGGICAANASLRNTTDTITGPGDIEMFQAVVQGDMRYEESRGLGMATHGGGHFTIGKKRTLPLFPSPSFPVYILFTEMLRERKRC